MPHRVDDDALFLDSIHNDKESSAQWKFTRSVRGTVATHVRMISERFDQGDNAQRESFGRLRLVQRDVSANLRKARHSQVRPDDV